MSTTEPTIQHQGSETNRNAPGIRVMAALVSLLAIVAVLGPTTRPAGAATYPSKMTSTGSWYDCTNRGLPGCASRGKVTAGTRLKMHCWIDDSSATGQYTSRRWFFVTTDRGVRGFVHSSRVGNQSSAPHCSTHRGISASRWAAMQIGETRPSAAEKSGNTNMTTWSGWCYVLAWDAHALSHGKQPLRGYGTAKRTYEEYRRRGKVSTNLNPAAISIGSIVFWNTGTYGHAAIYVGQGHVATTQGNGSSAPPNARLPMSTFGQPAGWVSPNNI